MALGIGKVELNIGLNDEALYQELVEKGELETYDPDPSVKGFRKARIQSGNPPLIVAGPGGDGKTYVLSKHEFAMRRVTAICMRRMIELIPG